MSVSGVSSSNFDPSLWQSHGQEQREMQRLAQALQGGDAAASPQSSPPAPPSTSNQSPAPSPDNSLLTALNNFDQALQSLVFVIQQDFTGAPAATTPPAATPATTNSPAVTTTPSMPSSTTATPNTPATPAPQPNGPESPDENPIVAAFNAVGQALQSGSLSAAQQAFTSLVRDLQQGENQNSQNSNPIAQAFNQLGQALQSGNLSAAQQAFSTLQQDLQQGFGRIGQGHHHHHHHSDSSADNSPVQAFNSLAQALQSGNLSAAQQAYSTLRQDLEPGTSTNTPAAPTTPATPPPATTPSLNLLA